MHGPLYISSTHVDSVIINYWYQEEKLNKTRQAVYYNVTLRRVRLTIVAWKSNKHYTLKVCVSVYLVMQGAQYLRRNVLLSVARTALF